MIGYDVFRVPMMPDDIEAWKKEYFNLNQTLEDLNRFNLKEELIEFVMKLPIPTNSYTMRRKLSQFLKINLSKQESAKIASNLMAENDMLHYKIMAVWSSGQYSMEPLDKSEIKFDIILKKQD